MKLFQRKLNATESKIAGILDAALPDSKVKVKDFGNYIQINIDGDILWVDSPTVSVFQKQYVISVNSRIVARSASLFRAIMLVSEAYTN